MGNSRKMQVENAFVNNQCNAISGRVYSGESYSRRIPPAAEIGPPRFGLSSISRIMPKNGAPQVIISALGSFSEGGRDK